MTKNKKAKPKAFVRIPIDKYNAPEYLEWLTESITVLNRTFFAEENIELDKADRDALYVLNDFQMRLLRMQKEERKAKKKKNRKKIEENSPE